MGESAIRSFQRQTREKDILLFVNHDKDYTRDVGVLTRSEVLQNGDWLTEYRLYDDYDANEHPELIENVNEAKRVWRRINGLPPYSKKQQYGFSIEGHIPENGVRVTDTGPVLLEVDLDPGVALVTRPAYPTSFAHSIAKSLGYLKPIKRDSLLEDELSRIQANESAREEFENLRDSLTSTLARIAGGTYSREEKELLLSQSLNAFRDRLIDLFRSGAFAQAEEQAREGPGLQSHGTQFQKPPEQKSAAGLVCDPTKSVRFQTALKKLKGAINQMKRQKSKNRRRKQRGNVGRVTSKTAGPGLADLLGAIREMTEAVQALGADAEEMDAPLEEMLTPGNPIDEIAESEYMDDDEEKDEAEYMDEDDEDDEEKDDEQEEKSRKGSERSRAKNEEGTADDDAENLTTEAYQPESLDSLELETAKSERRALAIKLRSIERRQETIESGIDSIMKSVAGLMQSVGIPEMIENLDSRERAKGENSRHKGLSPRNSEDLSDALAELLEDRRSSRSREPLRTLKSASREALPALFAK